MNQSELETCRDTLYSKPIKPSVKSPSSYDPCPKCGELKGIGNKQCKKCQSSFRRFIQQPDDSEIRYIALDKDYVAVVSANKYEQCMALKWHCDIHYRKDGSIKVIYARCSIRSETGKRTTLLMHRFILGITDPKIQVDHEDCNGLNCTDGNIRVATREQNGAHRRKHAGCSSQYKGVSWNKGCKNWQVHIQVNRISMYLGSFDIEIEAARCYDYWAVKLFGKFKLLNFPTPS